MGSALDAWTRFENYACIAMYVLGGKESCACFLVPMAGADLENLIRKFVLGCENSRLLLIT